MRPLEHITDDMFQPVAEFMHASAVKHAQKSNGLLIAIEPNTKEYEHQGLSHPIVRNKDGLADVEDLTPIAQAIRPQYTKLVDTITSIDQEEPEDTRTLSLVGEVLKSNQNVVFGYDHGEDVITFIMGAAAVSNVMRQKEYSFRSAIMASKMLDFLAIDLNNFGEARTLIEVILKKAAVEIEPNGLVHARNILSRVFDIQYLTIPNSQTTEDFRKRNKAVVASYNGYVRRQVSSDMKQSRFLRTKNPIFMHVATPGSLNYPLNVREFHKQKRRDMFAFIAQHGADRFEEGSVEVIGRASEGMVSMFERALTYAVVLKMNSDHPILAIDKSHLALSDPSAVRELGRKQVALLDQAEPDVIHVYDDKGNLPLIRG